MPRILLGAATLAAGRGGIAKVARLSGRVIAGAGYELDAVSYLDRPATEAPFPVEAARGSKFGFAARVLQHGRKADLCLYDSLGIARAHPYLFGARKPYAIWLHGVEAWRELPPRTLALLRGASRLFINSHHTLERVSKAHGPLPQARVCQLATETDASPTGGRPAGPPTALILGRIDAGENYKGHRELIAVWPEVLQKVPEARLLIAGSGSGLPHLEAFAARSPAANSIQFLGHVPERDMDALWRGTTLFAMPSRGEGFGLVYVEAMRHGVPVIASTHDAGCEVNREGETGFNVDLDQTGALGMRLVQLLTDRELVRRMGAAGKARWQAEFSFPAFRSRFQPLLDEWVAECAEPDAKR